MSKRVAENKQRISIIVEKDLVEQLDKEAKQSNITRTEVVTRACREHLALDPIPPTALQINALSDKISLLSRQIGNQEQILKSLPGATQNTLAYEEEKGVIEVNTTENEEKETTEKAKKSFWSFLTGK